MAATRDLMGEAVAPIAAQLNAREQRALLAILERQAAQTYRKLAGETTDMAASQGLMHAADNEDGIAVILEELDPGYREIEADLHRRFPQLDTIFGSVLDGRSFEEQLALQQAAESGAAGLFKSLADAESDPHAKQKLMDCSATEQSNADFLGTQLT